MEIPQNVEYSIVQEEVCVNPHASRVYDWLFACLDCDDDNLLKHDGVGDYKTLYDQVKDAVKALDDNSLVDENTKEFLNQRSLFWNIIKLRWGED